MTEVQKWLIPLHIPINMFVHFLKSRISCLIFGLSVSLQAENSVEEGKITPTPTSSTKNQLKATLRANTLSSLQKNAALVRKNHARHLADIKAGKINPFQSFFQAYPTLNKTLPILRKDYQAFLSSSNQKLKQQYASALLTKLQPLGSYLKPANYLTSFEGKLTTSQQQELFRLQSHPQRKPANLSESKKKLSFTSGATNWHTLQLIPVPISIQAPPHAQVFLQATAGGRFENGLSILEKKADKNGNLKTHWVSPGDAIELAQVKIVSPQCSNILHFNINVVQLHIQFPYPLNQKTTQQLLQKSPKEIQTFLKQHATLPKTKQPKDAQ